MTPCRILLALLALTTADLMGCATRAPRDCSTALTPINAISTAASAPSHAPHTNP